MIKLCQMVLKGVNWVHNAKKIKFHLKSTGFHGILKNIPSSCTV